MEEIPREGRAALVLGRYAQRRAGIAQIGQAWLPARAYASEAIANKRGGRQLSDETLSRCLPS